MSSRGGRGGALEINCCEQAALQSQWFYNMNGYIWLLGRPLGDLGRGTLVTVACGHVDAFMEPSGNGPRRQQLRRQLCWWRRQ